MRGGLIRIRNFARLDYLNNQRLQILKSANTPTSRRLQLINNKLIDRKVLELNGIVEDDDIISAYNPAKIGQEIFSVNALATDAYIKRALKKSIASDDQINKLLAKNASASVSKQLTEIQVERISKNLAYVEKTLSEADVNIELYRELVNKLPRTVSRQDILEKALETGQNYKGREYSYKELNQLSNDLSRYKIHSLDYEMGKIENDSAQRMGYKSINQTKTWIWSTLEKTRHEGMDGNTVDYYEKFEVINEVTGDIDYLRFPGDIMFDHNNCSNICNCACTWMIN